MEQFNAEAKALVEMQNEYVLLTSKNPCSPAKTPEKCATMISYAQKS